MKRRQFLHIAASGCMLAACDNNSVRPKVAPQTPNAGERPNIVLIVLDDLGYGALSCYGQQQFSTPNISRLAAEGMRFTNFYAGSAVCAPSRCALMTGLHTGHCQIRRNQAVGGERAWKLGSTFGGDWPLRAGTFTLPNALQEAGYRTGAFGKWGLGGPDTAGFATAQGFDTFYGYHSHRQAHTYYPEYLFRNEQVEWIKGNANGNKGVYSHDLIVTEAFRFIRENSKTPFFCYMPLTIPHLALEVPADSLEKYIDRWPEKPYQGKANGHPPCDRPAATFAGMMDRLDHDMGRLLALLAELSLDERTLVILTSDNGGIFAAHTGMDIFNENGGLRGFKGQLYEGGIRVPFIARWKGVIAPGSTSTFAGAFWDLLPTVCDIAGLAQPPDTDGVSLSSLMLDGQVPERLRSCHYWELDNMQAVLAGGWKLLRTWDANEHQMRAELYNLDEDPREQHDMASEEIQRAWDLVGLAEVERIPTTDSVSPFDEVVDQHLVAVFQSGLGTEDDSAVEVGPGFGWRGPHHAWTVTDATTKESVFSLVIDPIGGPLELELAAAPFLIPGVCDHHEVAVLVNGEQVTQWRVEKPGRYRAWIPQSVLALSDRGPLRVILRIPTAVKKAEDATKDEWTALRVSSFVLRQTRERVRALPQTQIS